MIYDVTFVGDTANATGNEDDHYKVMERDELKALVDNPEKLNQPGINNVTVCVNGDIWHIWEVSGYTGRKGAFRLKFDTI